MYLLDTDTLTHLHAGHERVLKALQEVDDADVGTTVVTKMELMRGRYDFLLKAADGEQLLRAQVWLERTEELLSQLLIVGFDQRSAGEFDRLAANRRLRKIGRADLLIAAIVLANRATLVTRNVRHFSHIKRLSVDNWVD